MARWVRRHLIRAPIARLRRQPLQPVPHRVLVHPELPGNRPLAHPPPRNTSMRYNETGNTNTRVRFTILYQAP